MCKIEWNWLSSLQGATRFRVGARKVKPNKIINGMVRHGILTQGKRKFCRILIQELQSEKGAKKGRYFLVDESVNSSDEESEYEAKNSDLEPIDSDEDEAEWAEVESWNKKDLMGDREDRKRLNAMTELDREMELEKRREKVELIFLQYSWKRWRKE
jgi:hypothetical protein